MALNRSPVNMETEEGGRNSSLYYGLREQEGDEGDLAHFVGGCTNQSADHQNWMIFSSTWSVRNSRIRLIIFNKSDQQKNTSFHGVRTQSYGSYKNSRKDF